MAWWDNTRWFMAGFGAASFLIIVIFKGVGWYINRKKTDE